ncbi:MAG: chorion class high-cysteine HCB protein 13 [Clostridiales bacterium]|nr:chorion class high-cysteine HCB protein 13 [Clostridiales bacterium]
MSDLTATNCGGGCGTPSNGCGCNLIFILLLLSCWGNGGTGFLSGGDGCGCSGGCDNWIWILILLCCCGNGF